MIGVHWSMWIQCETKKIFTQELPGTNFLYIIGDLEMLSKANFPSAKHSIIRYKVITKAYLVPTTLIK